MDDAITDIKTITRAIEAILFAAGHPVSYEKLSEVLGLPAREVKRLVEHMSLAYNGEDSERGILLLVGEEGCQLCTREEFAPYIREALGIRRGGNLSTSSLEVLAVIAYNQPVTRSYIDAVRGVDSSYAVNSLLDRNLIESCGRLDAPGRPMLYATTPDFLRVFGLTSLADLPDADALALASATKFEEVQQAEGIDTDKADETAEETAEIPAQEETVALENTPDTVETEAEADLLPDPEEEMPEGALAFDAILDDTD
ncbi:MAG: SMC-Scp complex subunit ScpB [Clostridia bacterium]|nr:SMC-Scp complex subunit ScpB [Clostridia bacterium]